MSLSSGSRAPRCVSCLWRSLKVDTPSLFSPIQMQIRGKKRLPRRTTITIRLVQDVKAYGRKGTILAIAPARMRNHLYPRSQAEYMAVAEIRQAEADEVVMERDASFGLVKQVPVKSAPQVVYDMKTITPQRSRELIEQLVPEVIEFQRTTISQDASQEPGSAIYGSVSNLDILTDITTRLSNKANEEGFGDAAKVVLSVHDIQVNTDVATVDAALESDRIKSLGDFDISINMKGVEPLKRKVRVIPLKEDS